MSEKTVTACVLVIGNEILSGRTKDANLPWLAEQLNAVGVRLMEARVIPDVEATIVTLLAATVMVERYPVPQNIPPFRKVNS